MLLDGFADLLLGNLARWSEVRQRLRYDRRLDAIADVDATITASVQDLLDGNAATIVNVAGDLLELRDEFVVEQCYLAKIRFAFAKRVRVGTLIGDDAATSCGDDLGAGEFAFGDETVVGIVVGDAASAILDTNFDLEPAPFNRLEQVVQRFFAGLPSHLVHGRATASSRSVETFCSIT